MSNSDLSNISAASLRRAADVSEKIEELREELAGILGGSSAPSASGTPAKKKKRKYTRRASTGAKSTAAPAKKKKKRARKPLSAEALANIRAAQAKRWAKVRAGKK